MCYYFYLKQSIPFPSFPFTHKHTSESHNGQLPRKTKCFLIQATIFSPYPYVVQQYHFCSTLESSLHYFLDMGTLAVDSEEISSDVYLSLGLKEKDKRMVGFPRVLSIISSLVERSVQRNEMVMEAKHMKDEGTVFHGLRAPTLSVAKYIDRIFKYSGCSPSCFVVSQIYVDRFLQCTEVKLTSLNVHRLLITSIMLAAKFMDDAFFNNAYYAKVGGVSTCELNRLEMNFLFSIDFRLQVSVDTFQRYCLQLEMEAAEAPQIERPMQACRIKESWSNKDDSTRASTIAR